MTTTLTFGDAGENHTGMEMLGTLGTPGSGFSNKELISMWKFLAEKEIIAEFHNLSLETNDAGILIIRNFLDSDGANELLEELAGLRWDTQYWDTRRGRVLNKLARANLVIVDGVTQTADYENKKGTIVDTFSLPIFKETKDKLRDLINESSNTDKADNLICEGNQYRDRKKCGIGYHGDTERRKVIAIRLGESMPMHWQWFYRHKPVGETFKYLLNHGDMYVMSEKAVGTDWRCSSRYTLRHAAGADRYLSLEKYFK